MKILLVKLSSLGDVVHTLPVVQDIHTAMPDAQIDWVVEKSFAPLLACCAGLHRVIPCEIRRWIKAPLALATRQEWRAFKAQLQQNSYHAVIDLQGLTKSAIVARLARLAPGGRRYALANQTEGSGYEAPTRWVADVAIHIKPHTPAVERSRLLAARALGYALQNKIDFGLKASVDQALPKPLSLKTTLKKVVFIHGTSRADKQWPLLDWIALGKRFNAAGWQVVLAHGHAKELATSQAIAKALQENDLANVLVWPLLRLDALTQALANCQGVIGVDSGVSHIAVGLDLPHVQLYNFDTAWRTGPASSPRQVSVFAQPVPTVDTVWQAWLTCSASENPSTTGHCGLGGLGGGLGALNTLSPVSSA